jgi:hypothetical protein
MALGHLLATLGLAALKVEARAIGRRLRVRIAAGAITGILLLTALGFGVAAFTAWLAGEIGVIAALLVVAGIMLLLALIVQVIARLALSRRSAAPPSRPVAERGDVASDTDAPSPGSELGSVAVVALVGYLLARQMSRR